MTLTNILKVTQALLHALLSTLQLPRKDSQVALLSTIWQLSRCGGAGGAEGGAWGASSSSRWHTGSSLCTYPEFTWHLCLSDKITHVILKKKARTILRKKKKRRKKRQGMYIQYIYLTVLYIRRNGVLFYLNTIELEYTSMHGYISRYIYVNNAGRICMSRCRSRYALYLYTICRVRVHVSRVGTRLSILLSM